VIQFIYQQDSQQQLVLSNRIKAFVAYNLFGNNAYQEIYSFDDPYIVLALEALDKKKEKTYN
jgi:hypothetical protein